MEFLYTHLEPGSFRPGYADTDSMCLGLSKTAVPKDGSTEAYYRNDILRKNILDFVYSL